MAAESVQGFIIFQQGRGVNDFAVYPNQILNNTKPVSTTKKNCSFISIFSLVLIKKLSQNVTTLELY